MLVSSSLSGVEAAHWAEEPPGLGGVAVAQIDPAVVVVADGAVVVGSEVEVLVVVVVAVVVAAVVAVVVVVAAVVVVVVVVVAVVVVVVVWAAHTRAGPPSFPGAPVPRFVYTVYAFDQDWPETILPCLP